MGETLTLTASDGHTLGAYRADPDGAGPLDSPLADAIETALSEVSIAGPAGEALGVMLDAPIGSASTRAE